MSDHPATDGTTEMPDFIRVGSGVAELSVSWRDLLEALPRLSPVQQEAIRCAVVTGGVVKMVKRLESERDTALSAQQSAERELGAANMTKAIYKDAGDAAERHIDSIEAELEALQSEREPERLQVFRLLRVVEAAKAASSVFGCIGVTGPVPDELRAALRALDAATEGGKLLCGECARPLHEPPCAPCTPDNPCGWGPPVCGIEPAPPQTDSPKARPHIVEGEFQSDKYPTCPRGKVPLSVKDPTAQDLLWEYAQRRRSVDAEFADDLEFALRGASFIPAQPQTEGQLCKHCGKDGAAAVHDSYSVAARHFGLKTHTFEPAPSQTEGGESAEAPTECDQCESPALYSWSDDAGNEYLECGNHSLPPKGSLLTHRLTDLRAQLAEVEKREAGLRETLESTHRRYVAASSSLDRAKQELAEAEKKNAELEKENDQRHQRMMLDIEEHHDREAALERELATSHAVAGSISQKTAREQREADAAFLDRWLEGKEKTPQDVHFADEALGYAPLVTDAPSKPECTCWNVGLPPERDEKCPLHGVNRPEQGEHEQHEAVRRENEKCETCASYLKPRADCPDCGGTGEAIPTCKHGAPNCTAEHE